MQLIVTGIYRAGTRPIMATATTSSNDTTPANNSAQANIAVTATGFTVGNFSTGDIHLKIPDSSAAGITVGFPVAVEGVAVQAAVGVRINHRYDSDLDMFLISPTGTVIPLSIAEAVHPQVAVVASRVLEGRSLKPTARTLARILMSTKSGGSNPRTIHLSTA